MKKIFNLINNFLFPSDERFKQYERWKKLISD